MSSYNPYKRKSHAKVIVISSIIAFLGLLAYENFAYPVSAAEPLVATEGNTGVIDKNAMAALDRIDRIKLDSTIFQNRAFRSLQDIAVVLTPQEVGRPNPFAPIPGIVNTPTARR